MCWGRCAGSDAEMLRGRSKPFRERGMLTGSTMMGGSSISWWVEPISEGGGASKDRLDLSSLSRLMERNLLDLRGCLKPDDVDGRSGDIDAELLLARLVTLLAGSVADLDRSRFACFWKNLGSLEACWVEGVLEESVFREFLLDINNWLVD